MATGKALDGKPYAGSPHMWIDEGEVASTATPRRGSLLYSKNALLAHPASVVRGMFLAISICLAIMTARSYADTPDAFVEWVQSDGTQYIDTGIKGRCNTSADMTIQWMEKSKDGSFLSSRTDSGDTRFILCSNSKIDQYYMAHRTITYARTNNVNVTYNTSAPDRIVSSISHDGTSVTYTMSANGTECINVTREEAALDTDLNMYLFAQNKGGNVDLKSAVRCYGAKIWQDGALVRDFRPCVTNGIAGLYDVKSEKIFLPEAGALEAGPVLKLRSRPDHFIQYVESTGSQYVDTEIVGRCNSAMEAHVLWGDNSLDKSFLSSRISDTGTTAEKDTRFILYSGNSMHYMAHRSYTRATDCTVSGSVSGSPVVTKRTAEPDYISSSISYDGTSVTYWMEVNGTKRINQTREEEGLNTGLNMYLFAQNLGGSPTLFSNVRCFDVKIRQDDVLVRDFLPCLKDGRAGLYDAVSGWIYFPQGGEFIYPDETPDKYVKWVSTPGANYVPVAVRAKSGIKAEMKFRPTDDSTENQYFLAARQSSSTDTRILLNYVYRKNATNKSISVGYKDVWRWRTWTMWTAKTDYELSAEITNDGNVNGTLVGTYDNYSTNTGTSGAFDTGLDLYMFAINMGGNAQDYYTGRFYCTTIDVYDETAGNYVPVRDFKPCVKDGNVMFYDAISQTMFKPYPAIPAEGNVGYNRGFIISFY